MKGMKQRGQKTSLAGEEEESWEKSLGSRVCDTPRIPKEGIPLGEGFSKRFNHWKI